MDLEADYSTFALRDALSSASRNFCLQSYRIFERHTNRLTEDREKLEKSTIHDVSNMSSLTLSLAKSASVDLREALMSPLFTDVNAVLDAIEANTIRAEPEEVSVLREFQEILVLVDRYWHFCELFLFNSCAGLMHTELVAWLKVCSYEYRIHYSI